MKAPTPSDGARPLEAITAQEWSKDLLVSWLFQTCIKLQTSLDRCFLKFGLTAQEATALLRCAGIERTTPGKLAAIVGRDKGKVSRVVDRLESSGFVTREMYARDRRYSILRATRKGKILARQLAYVFDRIRTELFLGIRESDVFQLGAMLRQLHKNASNINSGQKSDPVRRRRRIGTQPAKMQGQHTSEPQCAEQVLTSSNKGSPVMQEAPDAKGLGDQDCGIHSATYNGRNQ